MLSVRCMFQHQGPQFFDLYGVRWISVRLWKSRNLRLSFWSQNHIPRFRNQLDPIGRLAVANWRMPIGSCHVQKRYGFLTCNFVTCHWLSVVASHRDSLVGAMFDKIYLSTCVTHFMWYPHDSGGAFFCFFFKLRKSSKRTISDSLPCLGGHWLLAQHWSVGWHPWWQHWSRPKKMRTAVDQSIHQFQFSDPRAEDPERPKKSCPMNDWSTIAWVICLKME